MTENRREFLAKLGAIVDGIRSPEKAAKVVQSIAAIAVEPAPEKIFNSRGFDLFFTEIGMKVNYIEHRSGRVPDKIGENPDFYTLKRLMVGNGDPLGGSEWEKETLLRKAGNFAHYVKITFKGYSDSEVENILNSEQMEELYEERVYKSEFDKIRYKELKPLFLKIFKAGYKGGEWNQEAALKAAEEGMLELVKPSLDIWEAREDSFEESAKEFAEKFDHDITKSLLPKGSNVTRRYAEKKVVSKINYDESVEYDYRPFRYKIEIPRKYLETEHSWLGRTNQTIDLLENSFDTALRLIHQNHRKGIIEVELNWRDCGAEEKRGYGIADEAHKYFEEEANKALDTVSKSL